MDMMTMSAMLAQCWKRSVADQMLMRTHSLGLLENFLATWEGFSRTIATNPSTKNSPTVPSSAISADATARQRCPDMRITSALRINRVRSSRLMVALANTDSMSPRMIITFFGTSSTGKSSTLTSEYLRFGVAGLNSSAGTLIGTISGRLTRSEACSATSTGSSESNGATAAIASSRPGLSLRTL